MVIASDPDSGARGRWAARFAAAGKDLDNDHAAAAARARRAIIGRGVRIGCVMRCRRIDLRYWGGHQLPGARDVGLTACSAAIWIGANDNQDGESGVAARA